jgi:hypothetical protein
MSRLIFPIVLVIDSLGITAKASRGSLSFTSVLSPQCAFQQQRPKLDNDHENVNDSEERIPERDRKSKPGRLTE